MSYKTNIIKLEMSGKDPHRQDSRKATKEWARKGRRLQDKKLCFIEKMAA